MKYEDLIIVRLSNFIINYFKRCKIPSKQEIREYYPQYLKVHSHPVNKLFHIFGNISTWSYIGLIIFLSLVITWPFIFALILSPFVVYPLAWLGHWLEGNKPATLKGNPILTKICDNRMMLDLIRRKLPLDTRVIVPHKIKTEHWSLKINLPTKLIKLATNKKDKYWKHK